VEDIVELHNKIPNLQYNKLQLPGQ